MIFTLRSVIIEQENEKHINEVLIGFSKKHQVKLIATNNTFYLKKSDSLAHDILLCVKDGEKIATPKGRGRGFRYGLPNDEYYFKGPGRDESLVSACSGGHHQHTGSGR